MKARQVSEADHVAALRSRFTVERGFTAPVVASLRYGRPPVASSKLDRAQRYSGLTARATARLRVAKLPEQEHWTGVCTEKPI